ncbi:MAG TPA: hypothetical protein VLG25_00415 [Patescibacteria group bacterium]|nr:hypothetical protein [Patescibacteria group bacterium]
MTNRTEFDPMWAGHYGEDGPAKVAIRQLRYTLLDPGVEPVDYGLTVITDLRYGGIGPRGLVAEIGCGDGALLNLCQSEGLGDKWAGIEPNAKQFKGRPYMELKQPDAEVRWVLDHGTPREQRQLFRHVGKIAYEPVTLYKAGADLIPLPSRSAKVAISKFSGHLAFKNIDGLLEAKRVLEPTGVQADITFGSENNDLVIEDEDKMAEVLSEVVKEEMLPPRPPESLFTSEDTIEAFSRVHRNVYVKWVRQEMVFNNGPEIILDSHRTYRDRYIPASGGLPEKFCDPAYRDRPVVRSDIFEEVLRAVVLAPIEQAIKDGERRTAKIRRTFTVASDIEIDVPRGTNDEDGYEQIAP